MYLQFVSLLHTDKTQVVEIPPHERPELANIMATDNLATEVARASAAMILT